MQWPERIAARFDDGENSPGYLDLEGDADLNIAGDAFSTPFYLGRMLGENLFRLDWNEVLGLFETFLANETSNQGARMVRVQGGTMVTLDLLRFKYRERFHAQLAKRTKAIVAMESLLTNPNSSIDDLAAHARTTRKQVLRQSDTKYALRLLREVGVRIVNTGADF